MCLPKTNINFNDPTPRSQVHDQVKKIWNHHKFGWMASKCYTQNTTQPGGYLMLIPNKWSLRVTMEQDTSRLRWWFTAKITGKNGKKVAVICAYRVSQNTALNVSSYMAVHQQWALLKEAGIKKPNSCSQFLNDMEIYIKTLQGQEYNILLCLDANKVIHKPDNKNTGIQDLIHSCNLIDIHRTYHHNKNPPPRTYARGRMKINHILTSPSMINHVEQAGIDAFGHVFKSNHRGIWVDLNLS